MCWKGKASNFKEISDYIELNKGSEMLQKFEDKLADTSMLDYKVYEYRFKDKMTFFQISQKLGGMPTAYISKSLDSISLAFQIFFDIVY